MARKKTTPKVNRIPKKKAPTTCQCKGHIRVRQEDGLCGKCKLSVPEDKLAETPGAPEAEADDEGDDDRDLEAEEGELPEQEFEPSTSSSSSSSSSSSNTSSAPSSPAPRADSPPESPSAVAEDEGEKGESDAEVTSAPEKEDMAALRAQIAAMQRQMDELKVCLSHRRTDGVCHSHRCFIYI